MVEGEKAPRRHLVSVLPPTAAPISHALSRTSSGRAEKASCDLRAECLVGRPPPAWRLGL
ncbi:MAG: hypothetical protein LKI67_00340 [Olsenella sp.]|nr:hypothetical protein [Olsenella sp.]MCI1810298.1 hypothetical protein [Olsenella sp.]MCI1878718.1 hypothetical protein [Olsenella sp.]